MCKLIPGLGQLLQNKVSLCQEFAKRYYTIKDSVKLSSKLIRIQLQSIPHEVGQNIYDKLVELEDLLREPSPKVCI